MKLMQAVYVDDARVEALSHEAFLLVLDAYNESAPVKSAAAALRVLARTFHNGSTYDAFIEVQRVQALLGAVEAAERGEWDEVGRARGCPRVLPAACIGATGIVLDDWHPGEWLWPWDEGLPDPARAAREARRQLPRLVRIICGLEPCA